MLHTTLHFLVILLQVLLLFNLLIIVHEWGHFLAARWRGMVVEKFAIGFGKPIWQRKINGVEYCYGWIPCGGYVALPQMAPMEAMEGKSELKRDEIPPTSALNKIIVALAGPLFSFLLALVFAFAVWHVGRPVSDIEATTLVGYVEPGSEAEKAGIRPGDKILEVDGHPVVKFFGVGDSVMWRVIRSEGKTIPFKLKRGDKVYDVALHPIYEKRKFWQRQPLREVPFYPGVDGIILGPIMRYSPVEQAGLHAGDRILAANGEPIYSTAPITHAVEAHPDEPVVLTVERDGKQFDVPVKPEVPVAGETKPKLGIAFVPQIKVMYPTPLEQIKSSIYAVMTTLDALISPKSDVKASQMHGAIGIMNFYYSLFDSPEGWRQALWLTVIISVNLAIVNMLPIPVLDGGHVVLALVEAVRRKPINIKLLEAVQITCAGLIISFMLYVTFFDLQELPFPWRPAPQAIKFAPK